LSETTATAFDPPSTKPIVPEVQWTPEQKRAIDQIAVWAEGKGPQMMTLSGAAGTGKTTVMSAIKGLLRGPCAWTALTGKAALRLSQAAGVEGTTLHSSLYQQPTVKNDGQIEFVKVAKPKTKYLVVDESSMLNPKLWRDLAEWKRQGVSILFVGDGYQLPPIMTPTETAEHGEDFSVFREVPGPLLLKVMRSGDDIIRIATMLRESNQVPTKSEGAFTYMRVKFPGSTAISDFLADRDDHALITWRDQLRMEANSHIRNKLGYKTIIPMEGEPVLMCKNGQNVLNGEIHKAQGFTAAPTLGEVQTMWMTTADKRKLLISHQGREFPVDGNLPAIKNWKAFGAARGTAKMPDPIPITYGYVLTAHKAQGSEFRRVTVFLAEEDLSNRHFQKNTYLPNGEEMPFATRWLYTSLTRAKSAVSLVLGG
jgi:exodeoxyribonuclease-5